MQGPFRIYFSVDKQDITFAQQLERHLRQAMPGTELLIWNGSHQVPETYRKQAAQFLDKTQLFIAFISVNYEDTANARWELQQAMDVGSRRSAFRILSVLTRSAFIPNTLQGFPIAPGDHDPVEQPGLSVDRQLVRVAETVRSMLFNAPKAPKYSKVKLSLDLSDVRERLLPLLDRVDFKPIFDLLKAIAYDAGLLKSLFEAEDAFTNLIQQSRGLKTNLEEFLAKKEQYRTQLQNIIQWLREDELVPAWERIFIDHYYNFQKTPEPSVAPYFFIPTEHIAIPETLHLPGAQGAALSAEAIGLLSYQQKQDFRRSLLLAQDAIAIENFARAYAHCEHVRTHIDPESAQLYEYLLITYIYNNKSEQIITDALRAEGRMLNHTTLYSGRLQRYQEAGNCPTSTGAYNRRVAAEILSDGMRNVYESWQDDYILDTGRRTNADTHQQEARNFIEAAQLVYRAVHPMRGALRILVNELCGGGKFNWVSRVVFAADEIRLLSNERFDLESQITELIALIDVVDAGFPEKQAQQRLLLRENLYFNLLAKRQLLAAQVAEEQRNNQQFTDIYASVIRFMQACLLGHQMFGEASQNNKDQSFLRLALEYLLPDLVIDPDPVALFPHLRWFDFDAKGNFVAHEDSRSYQFEALAILEKIVHAHAGKAGWMQVAPNIKSAVYHQFNADTEALYASVKTGLKWTDIRRMHPVDARKKIITCLQRWMSAYYAFPELGQPMLDLIIIEIVGLGQMNWLFHDPYELATHPDSLAYGLDARAKLKEALRFSQHHTEASLRQTIAQHLFEARILPAYNAIEKNQEAQRTLLVRLLLECLTGYRLHANPAMLDFVYRELTEEIKFRWIDIDLKGQACAWPFQDDYQFDPLNVLELLHQQNPERYRRYEVRERIAQHRYRDLSTQYLHEISEYSKENRRPEREIAIGIVRRMKAIFRYCPKEIYLELPYRELSGKGRIRWYGMALGLLPTRENHFENQFYDFDYRYELFECKRLMSQQFELLRAVMIETGEIEA